MSVFSPDYAAGTRAADFAWWCETSLVQSVVQFAGKPLVLEQWQQRFFSEYARVPDRDRTPSVRSSRARPLRGAT